MVEVIGTVTSVQTSVLRQGSQGATALSTASAAPSPEASHVSSSIRVDNLQNVAILEYRSLETGEVLQQYPTQSQIDAFKRAQAAADHHEPSLSEAPAPQSSAAPPSAPQPTVSADGASSAPAPSGGTSIIA